MSAQCPRGRDVYGCLCNHIGGDFLLCVCHRRRGEFGDLISIDGEVMIFKYCAFVGRLSSAIILRDPGRFDRLHCVTAFYRCPFSSGTGECRFYRGEGVRLTCIS